jgi:hypothetical protein
MDDYGVFVTGGNELEHWLMKLLPGDRRAN